MPIPFRNKLYHQFFLSYLLIIGGAVMVILGFGSTILSEIQYYKDKALGTQYYFSENNVPKKTKRPKSLFGGLIKSQMVPLKPVNEDFSLIIEKIGVNAPIVKDVSVTDEKEYFEALKKGVAHAKGKSLPGETGNVYLFAHSSIEFWKMGPYATVFNQLRRLEKGDKIHVIRNGITYNYRVFDKEVVGGFNTEPYEVEYKNRSVLTLQTCDPPGTTLNRLIVRAELVDSK